MRKVIAKRAGRFLGGAAFVFAMGFGAVQVAQASGGCFPNHPDYCVGDCDQLCSSGQGACDKATSCCTCATTE